MKFDLHRAAWARSAARGGSLLYLLSAASILFGMSRILIPAYGRPEALAERFCALGVLNLYELLLLGAALVILLLRNVTDDAVALTALIAVFLGGSAVALDTAGATDPYATAFIGGGGLLLAAGKVWAVNRYVTGWMAPLLLASLGLFVGWNFAMPIVLALTLEAGMTIPPHFAVWEWSACALLPAGAMLWMSGLLSENGEVALREASRPFLKTRWMHWTFAGILFAASHAHLYVLGWIYSLPMESGHALPFAGLLALWLLEVRRASGRPLGVFDLTLALAPLGVAAAVLAQGGAVPATVTGISWYAHPGPFAAAMAAGLAVHGLRRRTPLLYPIAAAYALVLALASGPAAVRAPQELDWGRFALSLALVVSAVAFLRRSPAWAIGAAVSLALVLSASGPAWNWAQDERLSPLALFVLEAGAFTLLTGALFGPGFPRPAVILAATAVAAGVLHVFFRPVSGLYGPAVGSLVLLGFTLAAFRRTKDPLLWGPGSAPALVALHQLLSGRPGWIFVLGGFVLLAAGTLLSLKKGGAAANPDYS